MHRPKTLLLALALLVLTLPLVGGSPPGPTGPEYVPGDVLLKFKPNTTIAQIEGMRQQLGASKKWTFASGALHWKLAPGMAVERAIDILQREGLVEYAEPNYILNADVIPTFEDHGGRIETVLSDNGREFCGTSDTHPFERMHCTPRVETKTASLEPLSGVKVRVSESQLPMTMSSLVRTVP